MATTGLTEFANAINPAINKHFNSEGEALERKLNTFFHVGNQEDYNQQDAEYTGITNALPVVGEGENYTTDRPEQGFSTTYTPQKRGKKIIVTDELRRFNKDMKATLDLAKMRMRAAFDQAERDAANVFNHSTNTAYTSYGDGLPLGSTLHLLADGTTTQSNASSTSIALTEANLEAAILEFEDLLTSKGNPAAAYAEVLIVPPALVKEALIITKSSGRSDTSNNDANIYNSSMVKHEGRGLEVIEWKWLRSNLGGSDTRWFLMSRSDHMLNWKWVYKPILDQREEFDNDTFEYKVRMMYSYGWSHYKGFWVSNGTGVAYSS